MSISLNFKYNFINFILNVTIKIISMIFFENLYFNNETNVIIVSLIYISTFNNQIAFTFILIYSIISLKSKESKNCI